MNGAYQAVDANAHILGAGANSFQLIMYCSSGGGTFPIEFDNAYVTGGEGQAIVAVPALGDIGLWILGGLMAAAAILVLRART